MSNGSFRRLGSFRWQTLCKRLNAVFGLTGQTEPVWRIRQYL
jgi:hypothetical protein